MNGTTLPTPTKIGTGVLILSFAAFVTLYVMELHQTVMAIPATIGWAAALYGTRPLVPAEKRSSLYFAFGVMAFLIFFLHETYEYHGALRYFPLLVGWTGITLSLFDILSLTETGAGRAINLAFGSVLETAPGEGRRPGREITCFVIMAMSVVLIWLFGFLIAAPLFVFLWMWLWGRKPVRIALYVSGFTFAFIWLLFSQLLKADLYHGVVVEWLIERLQG